MRTVVTCSELGLGPVLVSPYFCSFTLGSDGFQLLQLLVSSPLQIRNHHVFRSSGRTRTHQHEDAGGLESMAPQSLSLSAWPPHRSGRVRTCTLAMRQVAQINSGGIEWCPSGAKEVGFSCVTLQTFLICQDCHLACPAPVGNDLGDDLGPWISIKHPQTNASNTSTQKPPCPSEFPCLALLNLSDLRREGTIEKLKPRKLRTQGLPALLKKPGTTWHNPAKRISQNDFGALVFM